MRYHTRRADGLYAPIPFFFVTDRMCAEILAERKLVLAATPAAARARQASLLERYDPALSANAFRDVLSLCHGKLQHDQA